MNPISRMRRKSLYKRYKFRPRISLAAPIILSFSTCIVHGWQKWEYSSHITDDWKELWSRADGPGERKGHSLVLFNDTKVILFGGRGNEVHRRHVPKRYNDVVEEEGVLHFSNYDGTPLSSVYSSGSSLCEPVETCVPLTSASSGNERVCSYSWDHLLRNDLSPKERSNIEEECGFVPVGVHYNDVWMYDTACSRYADAACENDGWRILHPGVIFGGCDDEREGIRVCDAPSERYGHGASMIGEHTMAIYGGSSHECEDYCDDLWMFDLMSLEWTKKESSYNPGKRWEFSVVGGGSNSGTASFFLFGGHRLWHGFSSDNNAENRWRNNELLPRGGYLDDLWRYDADLSQGGDGTWTQIEGIPSCVDAPGLTWKTRNDKYCEVRWPRARSGHAAIYDAHRNGIWIHGGFSTYFPYPTNTDPGSGHGVQKMGRGHITLQPTDYQFYLDDLWFFDIDSGIWEKRPILGSKPHRRTDHIISVSGNILILHGGYANNYHFNDTWYYIIDEKRWLEKVEFVHANYPEKCIDDLASIEKDETCIGLEFPSDLKRSNQSTLALKYQDILPFSEQSGYTPDPEHPFYFGIVDDAFEFVQELRTKYSENEVHDKKGHRIWLESTVPDGTPIAPKAATGPRQYARKKKVMFNATTELEVWEWCTSVKGEPTRGRLDDGKYGRANGSVLISQPRRQSPGWDGCREIQWKYPPSRSDHASVFVEKFNMIVAHGGLGYNPNEPAPPYPVIDMSPETRVLGDFWVLHLENCANNCSHHGVCVHGGYCKCDPGYYGMDCSNYTCPGSLCHYDEDHVQHCTHCCYDVIGDRKVPCDLLDHKEMIFSGTSEGICDGFGTCQCAPPFIGEDCSILDCKHNCSFNGYCSVEFPASRCMCKDGYTGEYCQNLECINNCSYPNGLCNPNTGKCTCATLYSPYHKSEAWDKWHGEDCSYLPAFSGVCPSWGVVVLFLVDLIIVSILLLMR